MKKRLLVCAYGAGHVRAVLPVIQSARACGDLEVSVLGLTAAGPILAQAGIPHLGFKDFVDPAADAEALAFGSELLGDSGSALIPREESVAYLGLSYADLAQRVGADEAARRYAELGRGAFLPLGILERVFDRIKPDLVLATNSPRAEEAAVRVARRRNIPAAVLVDLFGLGTDLPRLQDPAYGDVLCVLNEGVKAHLVAEGRDPERIHPTGNPAFDALLDPGLAAEGRRLRSERGWGDQTVVLYASGPDSRDPELPARIEARLRSIAAARADWHLVLRPHPNEPAPSGDLPPTVSLSGREDDLKVLLHAVDAVVVAISTVGLEAAIAGTPLVSCDFSSWSAGVPYSRMGLSVGAPSLDALEPALLEALQRRAEGGHPHFEPAAPKVLALLRRMLGLAPESPA
jgi:hypothetical protein